MEHRGKFISNFFHTRFHRIAFNVGQIFQMNIMTNLSLLLKCTKRCSPSGVTTKRETMKTTGFCAYVMHEECEILNLLQERNLCLDNSLNECERFASIRAQAARCWIKAVVDAGLPGNFVRKGRKFSNETRLLFNNASVEGIRVTTVE